MRREASALGQTICQGATTAMNTNRERRVSGVALGPSYSEAPMPISPRRLKRFSRWMDRKLCKLVDRWAHTAAPSALRPFRQVDGNVLT